MRKRALAVERAEMHDAGAGFQRAEEVHRMIRRITEEQRHRTVLAVAGTQKRRGRKVDHRFQFSVADRTVAEFDRRPRAVLRCRLRQQIRQRSARDRIVPVDTFRIELFDWMGPRYSCKPSVGPSLRRSSLRTPGPITPDLDIEKRPLLQCPTVSPRRMGPWLRRDDSSRCDP